MHGRRNDELETSKGRLHAAWLNLRRRRPQSIYQSLYVEGRYYHYISDSKLTYISNELGIPNITSVEREKKAEIRGVGGSRKTGETRSDIWRVELAQNVTSRLIDLDQVALAPDFSKRYFLATMYMEWGVLRTLDLDRDVAWFNGATGSEIVALCGSVHHLRGMESALRYPDWFPSRMDGMVEFMRRAAPTREEEKREANPWDHPRPETRETDAELLHKVLGYTATKDGQYRGWVDVLAECHLVVPGLTLKDSREARKHDSYRRSWADPRHVQHTFEQALFGSPVWVGDTTVGPPASWYPDPVRRDEGWFRYWNGTAWTDDVFKGGSRSVLPLKRGDVALPEGRTPHEIIHGGDLYENTFERGE